MRDDSLFVVKYACQYFAAILFWILFLHKEDCPMSKSTRNDKAGNVMMSGLHPDLSLKCSFSSLQVPGLDAASIKLRLETIVAQNSLQAFYPEQRLRALAAEVAQKDLAGFARRWRLQPKVSSLLTWSRALLI